MTGPDPVVVGPLIFGAIAMAYFIAGQFVTGRSYRHALFALAGVLLGLAVFAGVGA